nr:hypothetical protein [uncultured Campylobacter sp.]
MGDLAALPIDFLAGLGFWLDGLFAAKFIRKSGFCLGKNLVNLRGVLVKRYKT